MARVAYRRAGVSGEWRTVGRRTGPAPAGATDAVTLFEGDRWEVQRDEEVFEEILNHADLVVQAVVALEQM